MVGFWNHLSCDVHSQVEHPLHHTGVVHVYGEAHRCGKIKLGEGHFVLKVNPGVLIMVK